MRAALECSHRCRPAYTGINGHHAYPLTLKVSRMSIVSMPQPKRPHISPGFGCPSLHESYFECVSLHLSLCVDLGRQRLHPKQPINSQNPNHSALDPNPPTPGLWAPEPAYLTLIAPGAGVRVSSSVWLHLAPKSPPALSSSSLAGDKSIDPHCSALHRGGQTCVQKPVLSFSFGA